MRTSRRRRSRLWAFAVLLLASVHALEGHDVSPLALAIPVGGTGTFTVSDPGCQAQLTATVADPTIAAVSPGGVVVAFSQTYTVQGLRAGTTTILASWNGISPCVDTASRAVTVTVTPTAPPPAGNLRVAPDTIAEGTRDVRLTIAGSGFGPGTNVTTTPDIRIERVVVPTSDRIELLVSNAVGTPSGPRVFLVSTAGGGGGQVVVTVIPAASLAAPLSVTTAAVVFPRPGAFVTADDRLFARGILATAGTGVILGSWQLDGFAYERFAVTASGGDPVPIVSRVPIPVSSLGDHELALVVDQPQDLASEPVRLLAVTHREDSLRLLAPEADSAAIGPPVLRWTPVPGVEGYLVEWSRDGGDDDGLSFRTAESEWRPSEAQWREIGARRLWAVRPVFPVDVRGTRSAWRRLGDAAAGARPGSGVLLASSQGAPPAGASPQPHASGAAPLPGPAAAGDFRFDATAMATGVETSREITTPSTAHLAISSAGALRDGPWSVDEAGTLAGHHELEDPHRTVQDSRNFVLQGGWRSDPWGAGARVSYSSPAMNDQLQILTTGLARGGVELWAATPYGKLSGYETFDGAPLGTTSSFIGTDQRTRFVAYEAPLPSDRFLLRAVYLDVDDQGSPDGIVPPLHRRAFGGLARYTVSPKLAITLEVAHGTGDALGASGSAGNAFRLGLAGMLGTWRWAVNAHRVDASFVNPANRGLTVASRDRTSADVTLSRAFGRLAASVLYRYYESGTTSGTNDPKGRQHSGALSLALPVSSKVSLSATGTVTKDDADSGAGVTGALPGADRLQSGFQLAASEVLGRVALAESVGYTKVADRVSSVNDTRVTTASLSASGAASSRFTVVSAVSYTRLETELGGTAETFLVFVQPSWSIVPGHVSFTPRAGFVHTESGAAAIVTQSEQYLGNLQWTSSVGSGLGVGVGATAEWDRTRSSFAAVTPGFLHRLSATVAIRWGAVMKGENAPHAALPPMRPDAMRASAQPWGRPDGP